MLVIVVTLLFKLQGVIVEEFERTTPFILNSLLERVRNTNVSVSVETHLSSVSGLLTLVICATVFTVIAVFIVKFLVDVILG